jgi:hypothetical protein
MSIENLIINPGAYPLTLKALAEVLQGPQNGPARRRYMDALTDGLETLRSSETWWLDETRMEAGRIDGLRLEPAAPPSAIHGGRWRLFAPGFKPGEPVGFGHLIDAVSLVDAAKEVDGRYPLPSWWVELDHQVRPWRVNAASTTP